MDYQRMPLGDTCVEGLINLLQQVLNSKKVVQRAYEKVCVHLSSLASLGRLSQP